jgi:hypothetical protein
MDPSGSTQHGSSHGNSVSQPDLNVYYKSQQGSRFTATVSSDPPVKAVRSVCAVSSSFDAQLVSKSSDNEHVQLTHAPLGKIRSPVIVHQQAHYSNLSKPSNTSSRQPGYATQILFPHSQHSKSVSHSPDLGKISKASSSICEYLAVTPDDCTSSQSSSAGTSGLAPSQAVTAGLVSSSMSAVATGVCASPVLSTGLVSQSLCLSGTAGYQATLLEVSKPGVAGIHQQVSSQQSSMPSSVSIPDKQADFHMSLQMSSTLVGHPESCFLLTEPSLELPAVRTSHECNSQSFHETKELPSQYPMTIQKTLHMETDYESDFPPPPSELQLEQLKPEHSSKARQDSSEVNNQNIYNAFPSAGTTDCVLPTKVHFSPSLIPESQNQLLMKKPPPPVAAKPKLAVKGLIPSANKEAFNCLVKDPEDEQKQMQRLQEIRRLESRPYLTANEQAKLQRLHIEAEFDRRLKEANEEENKDCTELALSTVMYIFR